MRLMLAIVSLGLLGAAVAQDYRKLDEDQRYEELNKERQVLAQKMISSALAENRAYGWLKELTDIGPRLTGSKTSLTAIHWAKAKMREVGLENVRLQSLMAPHWERGSIESAQIVSSKMFQGSELNVAALGSTEGTAAKGITAGLVEVSSIEDLKALGNKVKDKIVFMSGDMPASVAGPDNAYGMSNAMRTRGPNIASKQGAGAYIVRSLTQGNDNVPHTGNTTYEDGVKKIPAVAIGVQDALFLSDALSQDPTLQINLRLSAKNHPPVETFNVIGEIIGSTPNEVIVLGGHLDSWDKGTGAHDDGGGCMQALEAVELFKRLGIKPKKTIRVVLYADEERGAAGGRFYAEQALQSKETHIAAIESDTGAFTPRGFYVEQDFALEPLKAFLPYLEGAGIEFIKPGSSGSDVHHIQNTKALIGLSVNEQRYFDFHHSEKDVFSAVHPRELELGSAAMGILAYLISEEW